MNLIKFYIKLRNVFHLVLISAGYAAFTRKPNNRQTILFDQSKIYSSKGRMVWGQSWSLYEYCRIIVKIEIFVLHRTQKVIYLLETYTEWRTD